MNGLPLERIVPGELLNKIIEDVVVNKERISIAKEYRGAPILRTARGYRRVYMSKYLSENVFLLNRGCDILKWIEGIGAANLLRERPMLAIEGQRRRQPFTGDPKTEVWERVLIGLNLEDITYPMGMGTLGTTTTSIMIVPVERIYEPESLATSDVERLTAELGLPVTFGWVELLRTAYKLAFLRNKWFEPYATPPFSTAFRGAVLVPEGVKRHPKRFPERNLNAFVAEIRAKRAALTRGRRNARRRNRWP